MKKGNLSSYLRTTATIILILSVFIVTPAHSTFIDLTFSGHYNTFGEVVAGQSGTNIPYSYRISYETSLNTNTFKFNAGSSLGGGNTAKNAFYGYSASGIIATNLSFGNQTWTKDDLVSIPVAPGVQADMWFDTDISQFTPSLCVISFLDGTPSPGSAELHLGNPFSSSGLVSIIPHSSVFDSMGYQALDISMSISRTTVPEPTTMILLGFSLLGVAGVSRKKTNTVT